MSKKYIKSPQPIPPRQTIQHNYNKINDIKQISSSNKKTAITNSKIISHNKNSQPNSKIKSMQDDLEGQQQQIPSNTKSKIKQENCTNSGLQSKTIKKINSQVPSPVSNSQNAKRFSKTSKIPTLKSTAAKGTSDESESEILRNSQSKIFPEQSSFQKSSINQVNEQSSIIVSALRSQMEILKTQNDQLKKQNDKLSKKIQKLKSLNDENKKLLRDRIESFNSEGENLRKLKFQISQLQKTIQQLNVKIINLQQENNELKANIQKINTPKISREIQTIILDQKNINKINNFKNQEQKYESSSSRKSYGGVLPLETVIKLTTPKLKINFKTAQSTPKKNQYNQQKLMDKYENYWSQKFARQPKKVNQNEQNICQEFEAKSELNEPLKRFQSLQDDHNINKVGQLDMMTNKQKINTVNGFPDRGNIQEYQVDEQKRKVYKKELNEIIQSIRYTQQNYEQRSDDVVYDKKGFSPTILIQNYRRISQQQQLIKSLYRVIQQLSKQIELIEKRQYRLYEQNKELKLKMSKIMSNNKVNKQINKINNPQINQIKQKSQVYKIIQQLKDDTLLLDQTKQSKDKHKNKNKQLITDNNYCNGIINNKRIIHNNGSINNKGIHNNNNIPGYNQLNYVQRINKLLLFQNYQNIPSTNQLNNKLNNQYNDKYNNQQRNIYNSKQHFYINKIQSAKQHKLTQFMIIDDISRFVHSQIICHDSDQQQSISSPYIHDQYQPSINNLQIVPQTQLYLQKYQIKQKLNNQPIIDNYNNVKTLQQLQQLDNDISQMEPKQSHQIIIKQIQKQIQQSNLSDIISNMQSLQQKQIHFQHINSINSNLQLQQQPQLQISQQPQLQHSQQPQLKIEDSLDALEYFSIHTPQNMSQNISCLNQISIEQNNVNKLTSSVKVQSKVNNSNILCIDKQNQLIERIQKMNPSIIQSINLRKISQQIQQQIYQISSQQSSQQSYRKRRLYQVDASIQKSLQDIQTTSKQLDQINIYQDSTINPNSLSII